MARRADASAATLANNRRVEGLSPHATRLKENAVGVRDLRESEE
jgi:hypothetical protein